MLYRQCIIWVGATVSPAMAVLGMINNYLLFFLSKWELLYLYRPPSNPWGEDDAKALNSKLVFTTLLFSSAPLLAWLARAPVCGPHAGEVVMSTYTNYMETEVSGFIRETVGATSMFLFNGTPLFFLLASASIALYFQTARIDSLQTALKQLKTDVEREHGERVAVVKAVSQLPTESGFILPTAWKRMQEEQAIDGLEGIPHPEHITWEQVNNLVRGNQLNLAQKPSEPSRGNRVIRNPMDGPATASRPAAQPIRNPMLSGAGMPGAPRRPGTGGEQKEEAADLLI